MQYFEEPTSDNPKYPCGTCKLNIHITKAVQCDLCNYWNHIKGDRMCYNTYEILKISDEQYICNQCKEEAIPFQKLSNQQFFTSIVKGISKDLDENSDPKIFPSPALKSFFRNTNDLNQPQDHNESSSVN